MNKQRKALSRTEQIYKDGDSKPRNPHMQTMLRMVGFGDNAGSGFPDILKTWANNGWKEPELVEDTILNQVSLTLQISTDKNERNVNEEKLESQNFVQNERTLKEVHQKDLTDFQHTKLKIGKVFLCGFLSFSYLFYLFGPILPYLD